MPSNQFSVGKDISLDIVGPQGNIKFNLITSFTARPDVVEHKIKGLDGVMRPVVFHEGWTGSFEIERSDSSLDDFWAQAESNYYAGQNLQQLFISETITEPTGSVTQYRFTGVILKLEDAGDWKGDATVRQRVSFLASRRLKVA